MACFRLIICIITLCTFSINPALAQELGKDNPYADYPQELLDNAEIVFDQCEATPFQAEHFDCRCRAVAYLDQAILEAPETPIQNIMNLMGNNCSNTEEMAGGAYSECITQGVALNVDQDSEVFCSCYGNTYSHAMASLRGQISNRAIIAARRHAIDYCRERG